MTLKEIIHGILFFIIAITIINFLIPNPIIEVKNSFGDIREETQCSWGSDCW